MKKNNLGWLGISSLLSICLFLPVIAIFYTAVGENSELFEHLMSTVMSTYIFNTISIALIVAVVSLLLGLPTAWFITMCQVPGSSFLQWALVLPLAIPGYIVGYIATDWLDFAGPLQVLIRDITGWKAGDYWFPDIRTVWGAGIVLSLVLYPYVYLMCRASFMEQSVSLLHSARILKCSPWQSFYRVSLPLARPAIAVGLSLVIMETVGDFGTMSYFAVNTLTTAIYDTWLGYSNINAAAKIAVYMLVIIFILLSLERFSRRKQKLFQNHFSSHEEMRYKVHGIRKWVITLWCWGIFTIAFVLPLAQLTLYGVNYWVESWNEDFYQYALNSFHVSIWAAVFAVVIAIIMNFYRRMNDTKYSVGLMRFSSVGYAIPGTVLAIGIMVPVTSLDHSINDLAKMMGWGRPGLVFSGTLFALVFGLLVRFTAVAIGSVENSLNKVSPSMDMAAKTMGHKTSSMLRKVHLPLVRRGCLVAGLLVFIESMKELNAALLLRPFNFETLATYVYGYASSEQLELASLPAILLVLVGLIPLVLINRSLESDH
ncbi:iron ABC transporter permease [Vibrio sp.]|nr:iron ABC transporter permease [Vibrio sp.]